MAYNGFLSAKQSRKEAASNLPSEGGKPSECIGCGKCESICPKNLIQLIPDKRNAVIKCASKDKGAVVKNYCEAGCIGCKICEKKCPKEAIVIENNLAIIDYDKCIGCGICAKECPKGVIEMINMPVKKQEAAE